MYIQDYSFKYKENKQGFIKRKRKAQRLTCEKSNMLNHDAFR